MIKISQKHQKIIGIFLEKGEMQSSDVYAEMGKIGEKISLVTVKRALSQMVGEGLVETFGSGRSTSYHIIPKGRIFFDINAKQYVSVEPDKRFGLSRYNYDLLSAMPPDIFADDELKILKAATMEYKKRTADLPASIQKKELERLVIELSWKSSKIEGNTYTLLDTEKLILENKEAPGHSKKETQMILNHKDAFNYIRQNSARFTTLTRKNMEELHAILVKDLSVGLGLRAKPVGVTGSKYLPLDNINQITEAVDALSAAVSRMATPYAKALIALLGIGYIQPFEDGNKRTSRLMANALLISHSLSPLSYRSVDEDEYRGAMLVFYELNSIIPLKRIFIGQYVFAAQNYAVK
ncbi:MAG: Filamentation induced by cAMP protein Fic [Parcubacteria group bacterium GW2011_GWA2_42_28]|nr:MAG: Filamentation induced by cAMP protein Fic [Parcubacteria group bacterium GW2011_GWA2_42_28]KKT55914.1 MAG: Filamentation induced by cAMP protein Fic [Parcubacteria group bacterium GW2011_GWC2_44_22]